MNPTLVKFFEGTIKGYMFGKDYADYIFNEKVDNENVLKFDVNNLMQLHTRPTLLNGVVYNDPGVLIVDNDLLAFASNQVFNDYIHAYRTLDEGTYDNIVERNNLQLGQWDSEMTSTSTTTTTDDDNFNLFDPDDDECVVKIFNTCKIINYDVNGFMNNKLDYNVGMFYYEPELISDNNSQVANYLMLNPTVIGFYSLSHLQRLWLDYKLQSVSGRIAPSQEINISIECKNIVYILVALALLVLFYKN